MVTSNLLAPVTLTRQVAIRSVRGVLDRHPARLSFAGRAGAGKTTVCEAIAEAKQPLLAIFNHADLMKAETLDWIAQARARALIPHDRATFDSFCDFLGLTPDRVRVDMMDVIGPVWEAFNELLDLVYTLRLDVTPFAALKGDAHVRRKVAFVDLYKSHFRTALQRYGQLVKDIGADPYYWVETTVTRGMAHRTCLNGDTRFPEEMEKLRSSGWTGIYLWIDDETQALRRPDLTLAQRTHISETALAPEDCDHVIDARQSLPVVLMEVATYLATL